MNKQNKTEHLGVAGNKNIHQDWRVASLILVHLYIIIHLLLWYVFDLQWWGKTAMMGIPSLLAGHINAAAVMVVLIFGSILFYGRGFCGWACHMRGVVELSGWLLRKLGIPRYQALAKNNTLINTRYRWLFRIGAIYILTIGVIVYWVRNKYNFYIDMKSPVPMADLPGYNNLLFNEQSPINLALHVNGFSYVDFMYGLSGFVFIWFVMGVVFNYFYGQGAFCRILCPYAVLLTPLMNLNPLQKKITRVADCTGCRKCSNNCPQGIDVSREIYHFNGKVINRECIKCYNCLDACDDGVLEDTGKPAIPQVIPRKEYIKTPWLSETKHLQIPEEKIGPVTDFFSFIFALFAGSLFSILGGFWFYVGAIFGFIGFRKAASLFVAASVEKG